MSHCFKIDLVFVILGESVIFDFLKIFDYQKISYY